MSVCSKCFPGGSKNTFWLLGGDTEKYHVHDCDSGLWCYGSMTLSHFLSTKMRVFLLVQNTVIFIIVK